MKNILTGVLAAALLFSADADDPILQAMREEVTRATSLKLSSLETPYFVQLTLDDAASTSASSTLGGLVRSDQTRYRLPGVQVRIGSHDFDNSNYVGSGFQFAGAYDLGRFPLDNQHAVLRRYFWLAIDQSYKSAVEAIARKRAALKSVTVSENVPDFAKAEALKRVEPAQFQPSDRRGWEERTRAWSAIFKQYPAIVNSSVDFEEVQNIRYLVNSEGTEVRTPERVAFVRARARSQAPDGMFVYDAVLAQSRNSITLAGDPEIPKAIQAMAENVTALAKAPLGENYSGPVLFEGISGAQFMAQVLGRNLSLFRRPVTEPGRPGAFPASEFEGRIGSRILPDWIDVVDDPTQKEWRGRPLFGHYTVDMEGVAPQPLSIVEKGMLKTFLLTRQPVKTFNGSNGRARLPGAFGAHTAAITNLFVQARETTPAADLKKKLIEMITARSKPYGIIVRKLDFPSSASLDEIRTLLSGSARSGGGIPLSPPILIYRVYPDGREELVRGMRFRGVNTRTLRDIQAASEEMHVLEYLDSAAPFALIGAGGFITETCVVAPSLLIDDVDLVKAEDQLPKLPIVPPPS
jgi:hypothetical protein